MTDKRDSLCCSSCGTRIAPNAGSCPTCGVHLDFNRRGRPVLSVQGTNADEVSEVSQQLAEVLMARKESRQLRSPWVSGSFYLAVAVLFVALLLAVGKVLPLWALPVVIIGALLLVSVVGAFQLRQDDRLSERGFLRLMRDTFRRLPQIAVPSKGPQSSPTEEP